MKTVSGHLLTLVTRLQTEPLPPHADARVEEKRRTHRRAYLPWPKQESALLLELQAEDWSEDDLSVLCPSPAPAQCCQNAPGTAPDPQ